MTVSVPVSLSIGFRKENLSNTTKRTQLSNNEMEIDERHKDDNTKATTPHRKESTIAHFVAVG